MSHNINKNTKTLPVLNRSAVGNTFPVTQCSFKCSAACSGTTTHYCLVVDQYTGGMIFEDDRICGKGFCSICAIESGYEGRTACPQCHPDSKIRLRRSPRHSAKRNNSSSSSGHDNNFGNLQPVTLQFQTPDHDNCVEDRETGNVSKKNEQSTGSRTIEELRYEVLNCKDLYTDENAFFNHLQDQGEPLTMTNSRAKNGYWKSTNDNNHRQYKDLKTAADGMIDRMRSHSNFFGTLPKYPLKTICNWFLTVRESHKTKRRDISEVTHPLYWNFVKDETDMDKIFYLVDQKQFLRKAVGLWGSSLEKSMKMFSKDDQVRLVGILLLDSFRDRLDVIQDNRKPRCVLDDNANMNKKVCFEEASKLFRDENITVLHPENWLEAVYKHGEGMEIEPNNPDRINLPWVGEDMQAIYIAVMKKYKATMKNWTKGTGGGSGAPEDYCNWETRDATEYYKGYADKFGGGMELTWIYMKDLKHGLPLYSSFKGLPDSAKMEDGVATTATNPASSSKATSTKYSQEIDAINKKETMLFSALDKMSNMLNTSLLTPNTSQSKAASKNSSSSSDTTTSAPRRTKKRAVITILREVNEIESKIAEKKKKRSELKGRVKRMSSKRTSASTHLLSAIHQVEMDVVILTNTRNSMMMEMNEASGNTAASLEEGYDKSMYFSDFDGSVDTSEDEDCEKE